MAFIATDLERNNKKSRLADWVVGMNIYFRIQILLESVSVTVTDLWDFEKSIPYIPHSWETFLLYVELMSITDADFGRETKHFCNYFGSRSNHKKEALTTTSTVKPKVDSRKMNKNNKPQIRKAQQKEGLARWAEEPPHLILRLSIQSCTKKKQWLKRTKTDSKWRQRCVRWGALRLAPHPKAFNATSHQLPLQD